MEMIGEEVMEWGAVAILEVVVKRGGLMAVVAAYHVNREEIDKVAERRFG